MLKFIAQKKTEQNFFKRKVSFKVKPCKRSYKKNARYE